MWQNHDLNYWNAIIIIINFWSITVLVYCKLIISAAVVLTAQICMHAK